MSSHPDFILSETFRIVLQLASATLIVWLALLVFRQRGLAGWVALVGATGYVLTTIAFIFQMGIYSLFSPGSIFANSVLDILIVDSATSVSLLAVLFSLLLHLLRKKSESQRIIELEAIIRDRDGAQ